MPSQVSLPAGVLLDALVRRALSGGRLVSYLVAEAPNQVRCGHDERSDNREHRREDEEEAEPPAYHNVG